MPDVCGVEPSPTRVRRRNRHRAGWPLHILQVKTHDETGDAVGTLYDMPSVEVEDPRGVFGAPK